VRIFHRFRLGRLQQLTVLTLWALIMQSPSKGQAVTDLTILALNDPTLANGFDYPVGDRNGKGAYVDQATGKRYQGWRITRAPGSVDDEYAPYSAEAWNGTGGGTTDLGQPVYSLAAGKVMSVSDDRRGTSVTLEHRFLDNGRLRTLHSSLTGIAELQVRAGDTVKRRQPLGKIARGMDGMPTQVYVELSDPSLAGEAAFLPPSGFISEHRSLCVPALEPKIVIAIKNRYQLYVCAKGKILQTLPIALSQNPLGPKQKEGDNCTPEGEYRITQKAMGPFDGDYGAYLGGAWLRLNYPNSADARVAFATNLITAKQRDEIVAANTARRLPRSDTPLGGGVGIHGWISDWPDGPQNLTWGCLSLRKADLAKLYSLVEKGTPVLILP
jgi:lipoprotein-anchoring transpeptidase ErfK/SrfK